jgi:hypothetical protein
MNKTEKENKRTAQIKITTVRWLFIRTHLVHALEGVAQAHTLRQLPQTDHQPFRAVLQR